MSVVTCSIVAALIWMCIFYDRSDTVQRIPFDGIRLSFPDWRNILQTYGMIAFQFDIHPMLMTIQVDMQDKRKIGNAVTYGILSEWRHLSPPSAVGHWAHLTDCALQ